MNDRIRKIMAKAFEVSVEQITINSSMDTLENWDSIHHINMIVMIEREFNIAIPDAEVANMLNYKLIESIINECSSGNIRI